jgi:beta-glucosidase/6-phospho-beta-glucosidase/beta-galactosidase
MHEMRRLGIVPIIDLVHFGLPDWLGDFQNPSGPQRFADYAHRFASATRGCGTTRRSTRST